MESIKPYGHRKTYLYKRFKEAGNYKCYLCGEPGGDNHHIVPLSKGGSDDEDNFILLCQKCHTTLRLHQDYEMLEYALAFQKHWVELGGGVRGDETIPEIPKPIKIRKVREIKSAHGLCKCGCGEEVLGRKDKKYANHLCRFRVRNKKRSDNQKKAIVLAISLLESVGYEVRKRPGLKDS